MPGFLEEQGDVQLVDGFRPGAFDFLALLPLQLAAAKQVDPVVDAVLQVGHKVEVVLFQLFAVVVVVEGPLRNHDFIPVFIERQHEKGEEGYRDGEQPSGI